MRKGATKTQIDHVVDRLRERGYGANLSGSEVSVIGAIGVLDDDKARLAEQLQSLPAVDRVVPVLKRFKLASREFQPNSTVVQVDGRVRDRITVSASAGEEECRTAALASERARAAVGDRVVAETIVRPPKLVNLVTRSA